MNRRLLLTALAALPLAAAPAARAATPPDTVVIAKQIDDIITLDPGEDYELSGVEIATNVYDRLLRYEAEDVSKLVGGVAESWTISDGRQGVHLQAAPEPGVPGRQPAHRRRRRVLAAARRDHGQDAGLPARPARLDQGQRQGRW